MLNQKADIAAHLDGNPVAMLEENQKRTAYLTKLLDEQMPNPAPGPGRPDYVGHQILYFDPGGDGQVAELWGSIDASTKHVGVFVPGTTAGLTNFENYSAKMQQLARADNSRSTATIAWLGCDMPDAVVANAPDPSYAETGGPALAGFVDGLQLSQGVDSTVIGHSYGGAVVGVADRDGLQVTRVVHVESAGAGRGVFSIGDYHESSPIQHYTMTAPGDVITVARQDKGFQDATGMGHGGNPDTMPGFTRLETGRHRDSPGLGAPGPNERVGMVAGVDSHGHVLDPNTTSWNNLQALISGGKVTLYTPPTHTTTQETTWVATPLGGGLPVTVTKQTTTYPYTDPNYHGPQADVPGAAR